MDLAHSLMILIKGKNEAGEALEEAGEQVEQLKKKTDTLNNMFRAMAVGGRLAVGGFVGALSLLATGALVAAGAVGAVVGAFTGFTISATYFASGAERISGAFQAIAQEDAPALLNALRENTAFMIGDIDLQRQYNRAYMLTGETLANRLPEAYRYLSKVALATGDDVNYLAERMYMSIGRMSTRWMAYIGTVVDLQEAQLRAAEMFGKTTEELTRQEIQAGMLDRVLEKLAARTAQLPDVMETTEQKVLAVGAAYQNLRFQLGEIFTPVLREVMDIVRSLLTAFTDMISMGGALYDFFRTISATFTVIGEGIGSFVQNLTAADSEFHSWLKRLADSAIETAWNAFSWGVNIAVELASGLIHGAATAITAAINFIIGLLSFWFAPGSPPRIAPEIDQWGAAAMEEFLKGFTMASYDVLSTVQTRLASAMNALVRAEFLTRQQGAEIFLRISEAMIMGLDHLQRVGQETVEMFAELGSIGGKLGENLVLLARRQMDASSAADRLKRATEALKAAQQELIDSQTHLEKVTDEYYMMLIEKASYEELVAKRAEKQAAEARARQAKSSLAAAEDEEEAAKAGLDEAKERLLLQERLVDQLILLINKQAELREEEERARAGGKAAGGRAGGGGAAPTLPEIDMPALAGGVARIDQAFKDLKDRIRLKLKELWGQVKTTWEESEAGQAIQDAIDAFNRLRTWLAQNGVTMENIIDRIAKPIYKWMADNTWGWVVQEWQKWVDWWNIEGTQLQLASGRTLRFVGKLAQDVWDVISTVIPDNFTFSGLQAMFEQSFEDARTVLRLFHLAVMGDWETFSDELKAYLLDVLRRHTVEVFEGWQETWHELIGVLTEKIVEYFGENEEVLAAAVEVFETVWDGVHEFYAGIGTFIQENVITPYWNLAAEVARVADVIGTVLSNVWTIASTIWTEVGRWINHNLVPWAEFLGRVWNRVWTEIGNKLATWYGIASGLWTLVGDWLIRKLKPWIEELEKAWDIAWRLMRLAAEIFWKVVEGLFGEVITYLTDKLPVAANTLQPIWETVMGALETASTKVRDIVKDILTAAQDLWNWISGKTFEFNFKLPDLPDWMIPGSPLPIHTAWSEFAKFLEHTQLQPKLFAPDEFNFGDARENFMRQQDLERRSQGGTHIYIEELVLPQVKDRESFLKELQDLV